MERYTFSRDYDDSIGGNVVTYGFTSEPKIVKIIQKTKKPVLQPYININAMHKTDRIKYR